MLDWQRQGSQHFGDAALSYPAEMQAYTAFLGGVARLSNLVLVCFGDGLCGNRGSWLGILVWSKMSTDCNAPKSNVKTRLYTPSTMNPQARLDIRGITEAVRDSVGFNDPPSSETLSSGFDKYDIPHFPTYEPGKTKCWAVYLAPVSARVKLSKTPSSD